MGEMKSVMERYCPRRGSNVIVEVSYRENGRTEQCLHAGECEHRGDCICRHPGQQTS